jgi:probable phosphoglycerate mutase
MIISEQLGIGPVVTLSGLVERDAGEWQGLTRRDIDEQYPGFLEQGRRPPGWETDESLVARALGCVDAMATALPSGEAIVVTHGGLIYALEGHLGASFERIGNLGGRWIAVDSSGIRLGDRIDLLGGVDVTVPDQI